MTNDQLTFTLHPHYETELAVLVSDDGEIAHAVWLPKPHIKLKVFPVADPDSTDSCVVTLPGWLAYDKGFI